MSRRRGEHRQIHARVPTQDGKLVAVRSRTVAERLFSQQQVIEKQAKQIRELERESDILHSQVKEQCSVLAHPLLSFLIRCHVVPFPPAPALKEGGVP